MAKLKTIDKILRDFVAAVFGDWNGDLAFTPDVLTNLRAGPFDQADVLEIVEDGDLINVEKEDAYETHIEFAGTTVCGASLRVKLSYNPHLSGFCVKEVLAE